MRNPPGYTKSKERFAIMTANIENIIIEHLKALRNDVREFRSETTQQFDDVKLRMQQVEAHVAGLRRDVSLVHDDIAVIHVRLDHIEKRVERVERRLDLTTV